MFQRFFEEVSVSFCLNLWNCSRVWFRSEFLVFNGTFQGFSFWWYFFQWFSRALSIGFIHW